MPTRTHRLAYADVAHKNATKKEPTVNLFPQHWLTNSLLDDGFIAQKAKEALEEGEKPEEIAILYRANFQSRVLEEAFLRSGVPYQVLGTRFYDRKEIKDIVSFIKLALNPQDFESMKRVINVPPRGIGKTTIGKIAGGQEDGLPAGMRLKLSQFRQILSDIAVFAETNKPSELIKYIIKHAGIEKMLKEKQLDELIKEVDELGK